MENVIVIEQKTFEELMARFNRLAGMVDRFCRKAEEKRLSEWLDSTEVCQILQISPRTLQTLRDNGTLAYSQMCARCSTGRRTCGASCRWWRNAAPWRP